MIVGKAKTRSAIRMMTSSTARPKYPAIAPSTEPMIAEETTRMSASGSESRAPKRVRLRTSRPSVSVPNQCAPLGGFSRGKACESGSKGAIRGTKIAMRNHSTMIVMPTMAIGRR